LRVLSDVAVVRLDALVWAQFKLQAQSKNFNIRRVAGRKWPIDPDKVSSADAGPNYQSPLQRGQTRARGIADRGSGRQSPWSSKRGFDKISKEKL
jgi:hypothetical protein